MKKYINIIMNTLYIYTIYIINLYNHVRDKNVIEIPIIEDIQVVKLFNVGLHTCDGWSETEE